MTRSREWFWKTGRSRKLGNFVYLRVAVQGQEELGKWLAGRARQMMDLVSRFGRDRNLSLSLVDDREIRGINAEWRDKDEHTDVLSFPLGDKVDSVGDVIVSLDTARRQAGEGGWPLKKELERLLAHGLAHCAGHTHDERAAALRMAEEEKGLLGEFGMVGDTYIKRWGAPKPKAAVAKRKAARPAPKRRPLAKKRVSTRAEKR